MSEGFYHEGHWIPKAPPPTWARCPVCDAFTAWENRTCPRCGVLALAVHIGSSWLDPPDFIEKHCEVLE